MTTHAQHAEQLEALLTNALEAPTTNLDNIFCHLSSAVGATDVADILSMVERDLDDTPITNLAGESVHLTLAPKETYSLPSPFMAAQNSKSWDTVMFEYLPKRVQKSNSDGRGSARRSCHAPFNNN